MISYAGRNRQTVNFLKAMCFDRPEWTPCAVHFLPATWMQYRGDLEALVLAHPRIFPSYRKGSVDFDFKKMWSPLYELGRHTDCWGTVWNNIARGFDSQVEREPLADWAAFADWRRRLPDPLTDAEFEARPDWDQVARDMAAARERGGLAAGGGLMHGHFFMRLYYLRGFENLMLDIASEEPRLEELSAILTAYNAAVVGAYLERGAEIMYFGEDLGMQTALPISPAAWRRVVKPSYQATFGPCRDRGVPVYLHSDGHILEIIPDLIETGVRVLNPQIRANGLAGLREVARGKVCLDQDLDRQLFPFTGPAGIREHIGEVFEGLNLKKGGLMFKAECGPDVSLENIDAICCTLEELCKPPDLRT